MAKHHFSHHHKISSRNIKRLVSTTLPTTNTKMTMIRSIIPAICLILVLTSNLEQADALAAIVRRVRRAGLFGIGRAQRTPTPVAAKLVAAPVSSPAATLEQPNVVNPVTAFDCFDADSYRREMTNLVYERSMERLHVN